MAKKHKSKQSKNLKRSSFTETVLKVFVDNPFRGLNFRQVSAALGISDPTSKELVKHIIQELVNADSLLEMNRGKYKLNPTVLNIPVSGKVVTGVIDMKQTGKAYVISKDTPEDIFIAANNTGRALNGDLVKVHLFPQRKDRRLEGQVVEVLERKLKNIVGTLQVSSRFAFLVPDSTAIPIDIFIPLTHLNKAKNGQKVIARITEWPPQSKNPFGEVVEILGKPGENNVEMNAILAQFDFPLDFPQAAKKEAEKIPDSIPEKEIALRRDFRQVFTCTIDPEDAKDFDDALSLRKLDNGNWEVGVHIADVSWYVKTGSAIDAEAFERGTSVYLVDRTIPMLPEKLSNNLCSLRPHEDKLCFSAVFEMDENAVVISEWFGKTIINSNKRYNYDYVQDVLDGKIKDEYEDSLKLLNKLAISLRQERMRRGSINFKSQEVKFILDENSKPIGAFVKEQKDSHRLIEDFMLLANRRVAEFIGKPKGKNPAKTFVYRIHDEPNPEKLTQFSDFLQRLGYKINLGNRKNLAASFNRLFEQIAGKGEENMIETIAIRTMQKAYYSTDNIGHYGLAFPYYTHFTSPIRRYPDLMVHRLLERYLQGKSSENKADYEDKCEHCSDMERKAVEAERASVKYKQAEYMLERIGEEFDGLISGVSKWGLFVEVLGTKCEGLVSLKTMHDDFYYLDEENYRVIGHRSGRVYKLGDPVRIKVRKIDLQKKQLDYELVEEKLPKK